MRAAEPRRAHKGPTEFTGDKSIVRRKVLCRSFCQFCFVRIRKYGIQGARYRLRNFRLDIEDVIGRQIPVIDFGPDMIVRFDIDELHIDAYPIAGPLYRAFHDSGHAQFAADVGNFLVRSCEAHHGGARYDVHVGYFREMRQQVVVHACRKERVIGIRATVFERQYGDRLLERRIGQGDGLNAGAFLLSRFNDVGRVGFQHMLIGSFHHDDDAQATMPSMIA